MNIPLDEIFSDTLGITRPATFVVDKNDASSDTYDIQVAFSRDVSDSYGAQNASPTVWTSTASIPGITNASQIIVHYGTLETESGEEMTTEDGEPIVLENEFTYNVRRAHADAFGVTTMELSLD